MLISRRGLIGSVAALAVTGTARAPAALGTLVAPKQDSDIVRAARRALATHGGAAAHRDVVGVADFSLASRDARFHLVDMANGRVSSFLVAHGRGSDPDHCGWLKRFSNDPGSSA